MPDNDPRVFFAAERTLLAWVRTGLGLIGAGFVVAKFAMFLELHPEARRSDHPWSAPFGIGLCLFGALACAISAWQHRRFCRTLGPTEVPPRYSAGPSLALGFGAALAGVLLAVMLVL